MEQKRKYQTLTEKTCSLCGVTKEASCFEKNRRQCRECRAKHYAKYARQNRDKFQEYKRECSCCTCGTADYRVLDFHHVNPEDKSYKLSGKAYTMPTMMEEMEKCQVLCSNCHRIKHSEDIEQERWLKSMYEILEQC